MKSEEALDKCIHALTTVHLWAIGGYPYDHTVIGDKVIVAELDPAKEHRRTMLMAYSVEECIEWGRKWGSGVDDGDYNLAVNLEDEALDDLHDMKGERL